MMDILRWLQRLGLEAYARAFQEHGIDDAVLRRLTAEDLKELGVASVGHRRKLLSAIAALPATESCEAPAPAAERRHLTVLFCDLVGSTALAARLDPEEMGEIIRAYQDCCAAVIDQHGGHIAKLIGDGLLAYFGFPRAQEHAAERAVRAGLGLVEAVGRLILPNGLRLQARVGIASGLAVIGEIAGTGAGRAVMAVGELMNLAARLQVLAAPGTVIVAASTRDLLGELFALESLGPRSLKGFADPVAAWRVTGENPVASRFEALHGHRLTPWSAVTGS